MRYTLPLAVAAIAAGIACPSIIAAQGTASIDFGSSQQTIAGFGGASAWLSLNSSQVTTLYDSGAGHLGLSVLRVRIDPGGQANWGTELSNAKLVKSRGAVVIATPWTPPASMKTNGSTVGGNLSTSQYGAYASYLQSYVNYMSSNGASLYAISMQNEPDANVTYESCFWTGAQMDTWMSNNASALSIPLFMPESESFTTSYSDPALNDANAVGHIGAVAGHLYGVSPSHYTNAFNRGKQVWMTEHYIDGSGISNALAVAKEINDSMAVANYSMYVWWWLTDLPSQNSYIGLIDATGNVKPAGWAVAQYARFIRPGYVRSNATYNPTSNIYVTAYKGNGSYVIVAINMGTSGVNQPFTIQNQSIGSLTPYQTSASALSMQQLATVYTANNSTFTGYLPPQSITTFVAQGSTGGTINTSAWYQVVNKTSGMCADDNGNSTTPGTALIQWSCGSGKYNQEWQFRPATTSGHYDVFNRNASSLTWDDYNFGTSNGTNVDLWTYISGQTNQQWQANYLGNGLWQFKNLNSGLCLDNTGSRTQGQQMWQWQCQSGNTNQQFQLIQQP